MKKLSIISCLAISVLSTAALAVGVIPTAAQKDAIQLLLNQGYHDVVLKGQGPQHCTKRRDDFDWEMQVFEGVSKEGHIVTGIVCNKNVYVKTITETNNLN